MEVYRHTPFSSPIVPNDLTSEHPKIKEVKGTGFIVRTYDLSTDPKISKQLLEEYKDAVKRWRRLGSYQGIELPVFDPVIGSEDGVSVSFFIPTQRVAGQNLENIILHFSELPHAKNLCNKLIEGLVEYSRDVFEERGEYLSDQNLSQYVYGKVEEGPAKIFFVDFGLESHTLPSSRGQHDENSYFFSRYMNSIGMMLEKLEEKTGGTLQEGRLALANFLSDIPSGSGGIRYARSLQNSLLQSRLSGFGRG